MPGLGSVLHGRTVAALPAPFKAPASGRTMRDRAAAPSGHAAAGRPASIRGWTFSAISTIERRASASSAQSWPA